MKPSDLGDDLEVFDSDWETEITLAIEDAKEWGLGFFIVFEDGSMGRSTIAEVSEIVEAWKAKIAVS